MSSINSQGGAKVETTYGTAVVVDRFWQFTSLGDLETRQVRLDSEGIRASGWTPRSDQVRVANQGATLPFEMEWMTKGMGWWLVHMLGTSATGSATDSAYPHTGTIGSLYGDFFTFQGNFPLHPAGTDQAITLTGCTIPSWELSCDVDGKMMLSGDIDAQSYVTNTALASASYASGAVPYDWVDLSLTIGGTAVPVTSWSIACNSNLNVDRYHQRGSALKQQPTHAGQREIEFELECDFSALTQHDRVRAANAATAHAAIVITATCADTATTIGSATQPSTVITMPAARFDEIGGITKEGPNGEGIMQTLSGVARWDGSNSPLTILYTSADSTA